MTALHLYLRQHITQEQDLQKRGLNITTFLFCLFSFSSTVYTIKESLQDSMLIMKRFNLLAWPIHT